MAVNRSLLSITLAAGGRGQRYTLWLDVYSDAVCS